MGREPEAGRKMLGASTPWWGQYGGYGNDNRRARRIARSREKAMLRRQKERGVL